MALVNYNKFLIYPIFYLLKGDYSPWRVFGAIQRYASNLSQSQEHQAPSNSTPAS